MTEEPIVEIRDLLAQIRDLLVPMSDAHRPEYDRRQAVRAVLSNDKRLHAWQLADGSRSQREIAKQAGMDEGGASRFFKSLREAEAISDAPNPTRAIEVG